MDNFFVKVSPESEGLSSKLITEFLDDLRAKKVDLHSFIIVRNNKVLAEGYAKPFNEDFKHRIYSCTKTLVSFAIGKLVTEGKISVSDKLVDFFPEFKDLADEEISKTTIEDLLTMRVAIPTTTYVDWSKVPSGIITYIKKDWAKSSFEAKWDLYNSTLFRYNTSASYLLNVIVEKLTGMPFLEYLRPEFDKLGISKDIFCVNSPDGYSWGGSGACCTLRDFAKMNLLLLNKGEFDGEQLISYDYMQKATSHIADTAVGGYKSVSNCGYGYQVWVEPYGYGMHGMYGQDSHCFPDKNFMVIIQSGFCNGYATVIREAIYDASVKMYKSLKDEPIKETISATKALNKAISKMTINYSFGEKHSVLEEKINKKRYVLENNRMKIEWFELHFLKRKGVLKFKNANGIQKIPFGYDDFIKTETPEKWSGKQIDTFMDKGYDSVSSLSWLTPTSALLQLKIIDIYFGQANFEFQFIEDKVVLNMTKFTEFFMYDYEGVAKGRLKN